MFAMRMAAFALGLLAAGPAMAQTAPSQGTAPAPDQQQAAPMPGMMGPGMMGPGMGMGMGGPGMGMQCGQGHKHGHQRGMGMGGPGMGMGGPGMAQGGQAVELTPEMVKTNMEARLARMGNPRIKLGEVTKMPDGTIIASVVTKKENAVVDKFAIDPKTHQRKRVD